MSKLNKLEKNIIQFAYGFQKNPGFTKKKSLIKHLEASENELDQAIDNLILKKYFKITNKRTHHDGICYELTKKGIKLKLKMGEIILNKWEELNIKVKIEIIGLIIAILSLVATIYLDKNEVITNGNQSPIIQRSNEVNITYGYQKDPNYLNQRIKSAQNLTPKEVVATYFSSQNEGKFSVACSLLPKSKCNSADGEEISGFSTEKSKYINGYENTEVWEVSGDNNLSKIICAKYSYKLKSDANPGEITEIFSFYLDKREDGQWEITSRICEKKFKEGVGTRSCPMPASKNYCT